jgi:hypothetical protein
VVRKAGSKPKLDPIGIVDILARPLFPPEPHRSLLEGVVRVPIWASAREIGGRLVVEDASVPSQSKSERIVESVDRLGDALIKIIAQQVSNAPKVAVLCTGGLDSSIVAALCAYVRNEPPTLITVTGGLISEPELELINCVARYLRAPRIVVDSDLSFRADDIVKQNENASWPAGGVFSSVWRIVAEHCIDEKISVILTGEGGNEICAPDGAEIMDLLRLGRITAALASFGRTRDTDYPNMIGFLRRARSHGFLPSRSGSSIDEPPATWYGHWQKSFDQSFRRWRCRMADMKYAGFSQCEAQSRIRIDGLEWYAPADPYKRIHIHHPLADEKFRIAYHAAPLEHRVGVRIGLRDKHLLRLLSRRWLPGFVAEHRKVGTANQISVMLASQRGTPIEIDNESAEWLGLDLDQTFCTPWLLPASAGLDWTQTQALLGWARNACR